MRRPSIMAALLLALTLASYALAQPAPEFRLGFAVLAEQIPGIVGQPLEEEHFGPNGDSLQRTSTGLMVWRKADNWSAFTNGWWTWIDGPFGIEGRPSDDRFEWERIVPTPTAIPTPTPVPTAPPTLTATPAPTPTPVHLLPAPRLAAPVDGAEVPREGMLELVWLPVVGAVSYSIELDDPGYPNPIPKASETASVVVGGMNMRGPYSWRVAAMDLAGRQGPWSPTWSYLVQDSADEPFPRSVPQLLTPANGSQVAGADPNAGIGLGSVSGSGPFQSFTWIGGNDGQYWYLQAWLDNDGENMIGRYFGENSAAFRVPRGRTLYWRVASGKGAWIGPYSPIWTVFGK